MLSKKVIAIRKEWLINNVTYKMQSFRKFDYSILNNCIYLKKKGRGSNHSVNEAWIMFDTETSKKVAQHDPAHNNHNHIVAWTVSIRFLGMNITTLFGRKPSDLVECLQLIHKALPGEETVFYCHNLPYDYVFLRKFLYKALGFPENQLNIKSHFPLYIKFKCGITLKDSLSLAQRRLEKWAEDLNVTRKASGYWDYTKIRNQDEDLRSLKEFRYIECDTLAGVECLNKTADILKKNVGSIPYTATGIVRGDLQKIGKKNRAHDRLKRQALSWSQYQKAIMIFHGGYTHGNRYFIDRSIWDKISCSDIASSYPFDLCALLYPSEKFTEIGEVSPEYILKYREDHAFMFRMTMVKPRLKDGAYPMPFMQFSKCVNSVNAIVDNGRILAADLISIYTTEISLPVFLEQYDYDLIRITECESAMKSYLPRWFTDYIFQKFEEKTKLKNHDPVLYAMAKARVNSIYGCSVMKVKTTINEDYETGDYYIPPVDEEENYKKYINKRSTILNYIWGVWCTEYATIRLFELGKCCSEWLYSDTDSVYGIGWDENKLAAFNARCKKQLRDNGYDAVFHEGREYWLGVAEPDGDYIGMRICGAKRYCCVRPDGSMKLTVAGVPKKTGAKCLNSLDEFTDGYVFPGSKTGKLTHTYYYIDDIYIDDQGNETGDSIDLTPCDYLLSTIDIFKLEDLFTEEVSYQSYE